MSNGSARALTRLQKAIDYHFNNQQLLQRALTHRSADSAAQGMHLERQEFLGDAVLELVISAYLHDRYPDKQEGDLSRMRSVLVRKESLQQVALRWQLVNYLCVGESERIRKGDVAIKSPSIAANAVEAVIGAVFEDGGWEAARRVVKRAWQPLLVDIGEIDARDPKSRLQELTQSKDWGLPDYSLTDFGAGVSPRFKAVCRVQGEVVAKGAGDRKKQAETAAAEQAYRKLNDE